MQHNENLTVTDFIESGNAFFILEQFQHAIIQYTNAIIKTPIGSNSNLVYIYNCRASAYCHLQDYDKAIADFTKAILLNPNDASLRINRSHAHINKGHLEKAHIDLQDGLYLMQKKLISNISLSNYVNLPSVTTNSMFNNTDNNKADAANEYTQKYNDVYRP